MNISKLLNIIFLFFNFYISAQENSIINLSKIDKPKAVLSNVEYNLLYRNYNNKLEILVGNEFDSTWLEIDNGVVKTTKNNFFYVVPGKGRVTNISVMSRIKDSSFVVNKWTFRVSNLPIPDLYIGSIDLSNINSISDSVFYIMTRFYAKYPPEIYLNYYFKVKEWEIKIDGKSYFGNGRDLTNEVKKAIHNTSIGGKVEFSYFKVIGGDEVSFSLKPNVSYIKKNVKPLFDPYKVKSPCNIKL